MADQDLLDRLAGEGTIVLPSLTDEELASIHAERDMPVRLPVLRQIPEEARSVILGTALRSLVVRGLVEAPVGRPAPGQASGEIEVGLRGNLDAVLAIRRAPAALLSVVGTSEATILYGVRERGTAAYLEERLDELAFHHFRLLTPERAVEEVARTADPEQRTPAPPAAPASDADRSAVLPLLTSSEPQPGVTRIDANRPDRPASQTWIVVRPQATFVVTQTVDGEPRPPSVTSVDADDLRARLRAILVQEGGEQS